MILLYAFFVIATLVNLVILIGVANFMLRFGEKITVFMLEHREFQEQHLRFMNEVRQKKWLIEISNRVSQL